MSYVCRSGPTAAIRNRSSWAPISSPIIDPKKYHRPLSGNFDRIYNAFERTNTFQVVKSSQGKEERKSVQGDIVVNRKSSTFERAECSLAAQAPSALDEDYYREKILYSQARQLFPLQEDLADWICKTIDITYLTGENFFDVLDNGVELCQLASVIHDKATEAFQQGLITEPVVAIRGKCWQRAARRSFFSRDNTENFITFCRELGVHENLLFESDDLVLHNQPRQVILCLLELARIATKYNVEPPGLVQLEREIALEERDSGLDSAMSNAGWQFRGESPQDLDRTLTDTHKDGKENEKSLSDQTETESNKSEDSDVPLKPTNELDKRVQLVTRLMERGCNCGAGKCSKLLKVKKVGEGRYNIAGRNVFIRLLKGRHMMVRVGGGWDTLEHFLSRHEPCQVRLVTQSHRGSTPPSSLPLHPPSTTALRKQSAPSFTTPRNAKAPNEHKFVSNIPKKSRSLSLATIPSSEGKGLAKNRSLATTPTDTPRKDRSQSLATTPVDGKKSFCGTDRLNQSAKKTRSMSLATPVAFRPINKSISLTIPGAMTQAAIEESIRLSLAASIVEDSIKKPFLHIKAKYRSPPPREVPPR